MISSPKDQTDKIKIEQESIKIIPVYLFPKLTSDNNKSKTKLSVNQKSSHNRHASIILHHPDHDEDHIDRGMCFMVNGFRVVLIVLALIETYFIIIKLINFSQHKRQLIEEQYKGDRSQFTTNLVWIGLDLFTACFLVVELVLNGLVLLVISLVCKMGIFIYNCYIYSGHYDPHTIVEGQDLILNGVNIALVACYAMLKGFHVYDYHEHGGYSDICTLKIH